MQGREDAEVFFFCYLGYTTGIVLKICFYQLFFSEFELKISLVDLDSLSDLLLAQQAAQPLKMTNLFC